jgi:hypothetical protein
MTGRQIRWTSVLLLAMVGEAVGAGSAGTSVDFAKAQLQKVHPQASFFMTGDRVTSVYGPAFAFGDSPKQTADAFVAQHGAIFGLAAGDLVEGSLAGDNAHIRPVMVNPETGGPKFMLVSYLQQRSGIPVFRSDVRLLVRDEPGYPLVLARAASFDLGEFQVNEAAAQAPALAEARNNVAIRYPGMVQFSEPSLVIWAGYDDAPASPTLAVTFTGTAFDASSPRYAKRLFVADAQTGEILWSENQISHMTDVSGKIEGQATSGPKADICATEAAVGLPYALAKIGATTVFADNNGNFTIPNPGSAPVTVQSELAGKWFRTHIGGSGGAVAEAQSKPSITPPGPANFMFNAANNSETFRGGVNAYYHANVVRDFALKYAPAYPTIGTQENWPVNVNVSGTCNAFYDQNSINFFLAGGGCPNTAFSVVVHHEYGHHLVNRAGSGQGQYGEGMSDTMGVMIMDDSGLAYGFFNDCAVPLRNAENTHQYPCNGAIHDCGQLMSGCVWDTMKELKITNPSDWKDIIGDLGVNAILLHTGDLITPQITIDYLTLDDDDANIGNGTPHYTQIAVGFGKHNMDAPPLQLLQFNYPSGKPTIITPNQPFQFPMNITGIVGIPIANTGKLFYKINNGAFTSLALPQGAPNNYTVTLPATNCGDNIAWYLQAGANPNNQTVTDPFGAPSNTFNTLVAFGTIPGTVSYDFNTGLPPGWTANSLWHITSSCNTSGSCDSGTFAYFGQDSSCTFIEGQTSSGSLTSPLIAVPPSPNAKLEFCYRYQGEGGQPYDAAHVKVNGTTVFDASAAPSNSWTNKSISLASFAGQQVKVEFFFNTVDSIINDSLGFQVDGVKISGEVADCTPKCYADCDGDGSLSIDDFICFQTFFALQDPYADCDGDGSLSIDDFICFQTFFAIGC